MMKLWMYEKHIRELRSEELFEGRSSQFQAFFSQLHKLCIQLQWSSFINNLSFIEMENPGKWNSLLMGVWIFSGTTELRESISRGFASDSMII